jgi:hypothetical protein
VVVPAAADHHLPLLNFLAILPYLLVLLVPEVALVELPQRLAVYLVVRVVEQAHLEIPVSPVVVVPVVQEILHLCHHHKVFQAAPLPAPVAAPVMELVAAEPLLLALLVQLPREPAP